MYDVSQTPRPRPGWLFGPLDTPDQLRATIRFGAGLVAFLAALQLVVMLTHGDGYDRSPDALIYLVATWFLVTKHSRLAAGLALGFYLVGQALLVLLPLTVWGVPARPNVTSVFILVGLVQTLRATIRWHRLAPADAAPLAACPAVP